MPQELQEWLPREDVLTYEETVRLIRVATGLGVSKVRITGGEPLTRRDVLSLFDQLQSIDAIADLGLSTNGTLLARKTASGATMAERMRAAGVRSVIVSNVDNLAARVDPAIVGMHVLAGTPLTVEVVAKERDTGGAPARVDGRPRLLEAMQFPPEFDQELVPVFNTNTSLITVEALAEPGELTWLVVEKTVAGEPVIQFERLYHELSAHVATTFLVCPRRGPRGRFLPVKEPADLAEIEPLLRRLLAVPPTVV